MSARTRIRRRTVVSAAISVSLSRSGRTAYTADQTAGTVTAVDPRAGVVEETVATGLNPNHVEVADGIAYVVDKSGAGAGGEDLVTRIRIGR